jgi:hypothetical protein
VLLFFLGPKKFDRKSPFDESFELEDVPAFVDVVSGPFRDIPLLVAVFVAVLLPEGKKADDIETVVLAIDDKILGTRLTIRKLKNISTKIITAIIMAFVDVFNIDVAFSIVIRLYHII